MVQPDRFHTAEQIAPHTWRIDEAGLANCYLLEGGDKALLIDAACGAGDLRACVAGLTAKPVVAAVTHRHPDHIGGTGSFGRYYAGRADLKPVYSLMCLPCFGRALLRHAGCRGAADAKPKHAAVLPMEDGCVFELGGRRVTAVAVPGHTKGSVMFVDEGEKLVFTGDDINPDLWMHLPGCTDLKTWCRGADRILSVMEAGYTAWNGHGNGRQPLEQALQTKALVLELMEKRKRGELRSRHGSYPSEKAAVVVRYRF